MYILYGTCTHPLHLVLHVYIYRSIHSVLQHTHPVCIHMWQSHRNRRIFRRVFHFVQSIVMLKFRQGWRSYALHRFIRYSCIYEARMSPALNRSSVVWRFKHSNVTEIHDGMIFNFYMGLSHIGNIGRLWYRYIPT